MKARVATLAVAGLCMLGLGGCSEEWCRHGGGIWGYIVDAFGCGGGADLVPADVKFSVAPDVLHVGDPAAFDGVRLSGDLNRQSARPLLGWEWDFESDGRFDAGGFGVPPDAAAAFQEEAQNPYRKVEHRFTRAGDYVVHLKATDRYGLVSDYSETLTVLPAQGGQQANGEPVAALTAAPNPARPDQTVTFDASGSHDPDGSIKGYQWDLDGNGTFERSTGAQPTTTNSYSADTQRVVVSVRVTDDGGATGTASVTVHINEPQGPQRVRAARARRAGSWLVFATLKGFAPTRTGRVVRGRIHARAVPAGPVRPKARKLPRVVRRLLAARWAVKLTGRKGTAIAGIAVARAAGRTACLRLRLTARSVPTGSFALLGGTGAFARLRLQARFSLDSGLGRDTQVGGSLKYSTGRPKKPTRACRRLR
jgi:hypothetical protein